MSTMKLFLTNLPALHFKVNKQIKNAIITGVLFLILSIPSFSQNVGISATGLPTDNSAGLDINFTNKGLLIPRVSLTSTTDATTIPSPATSLLVYNSNASMTAGSVGYWYWNGAAWIKLNDAGASTDWSTLGNAGTLAGTNFLGTIDNQNLQFKINNIQAGLLKTDGQTFLGLNAGINNTGSNNTALGGSSLYSNTTGNSNTAAGLQALYSNTTGTSNTAVGLSALHNNTTASFNTATGSNSLYSNTTGSNNSAVGNGALHNNTTGSSNSAIGNNALLSNTTGNQNTASGQNSIYSNTTGLQNTASGYQALYFNTIGYSNTAIGYRALYTNSSGYNNTALGYGADISGDGVVNATAIGYHAIAGASYSLILGGTGADQVTVGIGTTTPSSYLETAGSFGTGIITTSNDIILDNTNYTVIVTPGRSIQVEPVTITLPAPGDAINRTYRIINRFDNDIIISPYLDFVDTDSHGRTTIPASSKIDIQSDGSDWYRVD